MTSAPHFPSFLATQQAASHCPTPPDALDTHARNVGTPGYFLQEEGWIDIPMTAPAWGTYRSLLVLSS